MVSIARRDLRAGRGRLAASVGGVAFSILLVLFVLGFYNGFLLGAAGFVTDAGADVWVLQEDTVDPSGSTLQSHTADKIRSVAGVSSVTEFFTRYVVAEIGGKDGPKADVLVVGFDTRTGIGAPKKMLFGTDEVERQEVVVSRAFFEANGLALGERIHFANRDWKVVGVADTGSFAFVGYAFADTLALQDAFDAGPLVNGFLVMTKPGEDPVRVAEAIERRVDSVSAYETESYAAEYSESIREVFVPILLAIFVIGSGVGLAVVTITTWSSVNERVSEFGVLKAIGAGNRTLYSAVLATSTVSASLGFVAALAAYLLISRWMEAANARIVLVTVWRDVALVGLAVLALAVLASWMPVRRVARIDPADVFRGM